MGKILLNRCIKYCRQNILMFIALLILVASVVTVVLSLECTAYTILDGKTNSSEYENIEDGQFTTRFRLLERELQKLADDHDVVIQEMFSADYETRGITYRFFTNRPFIDKLSLNEGQKPIATNDIVVEQIFALKNDLHVGDRIEIGSKIYKISGIGSIPDYGHPTKTRGDVGIVPEKFTWAIITDESFEELLDARITESPEYTYSYLAGNTDIVKFSDDLPNCLAFVPREDNRRMDVEIQYAKLYRTLGFIIGSILIAMLAYIFAVVTKNQIRNEHLTIGSLYALGISKSTIMIMYILPTLVITVLGGLIGLIVGLTPDVVSIAIDAFHKTNSFPYYEFSKPLILYLYAIVMPPLVSFCVNLVILNQTLSSTALSLMRGTYEKISIAKSKI
ncbi:MAG: hypothetical protein Q4E99_06175, partial [Bacillota bacterium]|nr:hypothetical protein [Bacillota bacterium]